MFDAISPSERVITARWLRGSTIIVEHSEKGAYPYLLRNLTEEEVAHANFLGEFRAVSYGDPPRNAYS